MHEALTDTLTLELSDYEDSFVLFEATQFMVICESAMGH